MRWFTSVFRAIKPSCVAIACGIPHARVTETFENVGIMRLSSNIRCPCAFPVPHNSVICALMDGNLPCMESTVTKNREEKGEVFMLARGFNCIGSREAPRNAKGG